MVSGRTIRTRPRTRPPQTPTPRRVSPPASGVATTVAARHSPLKTVGRHHGGQPALFGAPAGHQAGHVGGQRVEFVDQQVEDVVEGVEHTGVDQSAPVFTQQAAQHPDGAHHLVAADFAVTQLTGGQRATGLARNGITGCLRLRRARSVQAIWPPSGPATQGRRRSWATASRPPPDRGGRSAPARLRPRRETPAPRGQLVQVLPRPARRRTTFGSRCAAAASRCTASTDRALANSGPAGVACHDRTSPRSNTLNAAHTMNDPEASTQPCTTWSRANRIRLCSRRSVELREDLRRQARSRRSTSATKSRVSRGDPALEAHQVDAEHADVAEGAQLPAQHGWIPTADAPRRRSAATAMLGPKNPLLPTIVSGLANGTVSAMKCADVIAPYSRCANTPTVRMAISRWTIPPGRSRPAIDHARRRAARAR